MTMRDAPHRRAALAGGAAVMLGGAGAGASEPALAELERRLEGGRLGVYAVNLAGSSPIQHRGDERFPMASTFSGRTFTSYPSDMTKPPSRTTTVSYTHLTLPTNREV